MLVICILIKKTGLVSQYGITVNWNVIVLDRNTIIIIIHHGARVGFYTTVGSCPCVSVSNIKVDPSRLAISSDHVVIAGKNSFGFEFVASFFF